MKFKSFKFTKIRTVGYSTPDPETITEKADKGINSWLAKNQSIKIESTNQSMTGDSDWVSVFISIFYTES